MLIQYRFHSIKAEESGVQSYIQGKKQPPIYQYTIEGFFFRSYKDGGTKLDCATVDDAIAKAKKVIDSKFEEEEKKAGLRRYFVEQDYKYFVEHLKSNKVSPEQIPMVASTLALATTQKGLFTQTLDVDISGSHIDISGSVSTDS